MYSNLKAEMARNNIMIKDIANVLNVRYATVSDKINGKYRFYLDEAEKIKLHFFPNLPLEYLFQKDKVKRG